jgi:FAD/FMN-containing dehydrogenase
MTILLINVESFSSAGDLAYAAPGKCRRLARKCGVDIAEAEFNKRVDELWKIAHRIFAIQAHTIDGIKIKLQTVERLEIENDNNLEDAWASLKKDIRALSVV